MRSAIRFATPADTAQILAIYAPFVTDTSITFEYTVPEEENYAKRIEIVQDQYPWLVYEKEGKVGGFAYATSYRERKAYQWSTELSVYLNEDLRGQGIGKALYITLIALLKEQGYYNAYGVITMPNEASVGLHEKLGFRKCAIFPKTGYKNGAWHDVGWWIYDIQPHPDNVQDPTPIAKLSREVVHQCLQKGMDVLERNT